MTVHKFQNSVADIVLRDIDTGEALAHGKTNTTTALEQTMSKVEARGGIGNQILYSYFTDRSVSFSIEMPTFNSWMLALQVGADVGTDNYSVVATDCLVLSSGSGQLDNTPTGDVTFIFDDNDASLLVTPSGSNITVAAGADRKGTAIYDYLAAADRITVAGQTQPSIVQLVMTANVYDQDNTTVVQNFQINVPRFKLDGNYSLAMASDAISSQAMAGEALLNSATDCSTDDYYYTATYINVDSSVTPYSQISATPSPMSFSAAAGSATQSLSVLGYRGVVYSSTSLTDDCAYTLTSGSWCTSSSAACIDVGAATGIVTANGSLMADGDDAVVNVAYWDLVSGSLTDTVYVAITA